MPDREPRRRYDSRSRRARARESRDAVVTAGRRRFLRDGYHGSTVPGIARDAGVSVETVYKAFGSKAGLLEAVCAATLEDDAVLGSEPPIDVPDARVRLVVWAEHHVSVVAPRTAAVLLVVRTSAADPTVGRLWRRLRDDSRLRTGRLATDLSAQGDLRPSVTLAEASDILWSLSSPELWAMLVVDRGWAPERFGIWMAETAIASLLG